MICFAVLAATRPNPRACRRTPDRPALRSGFAACSGHVPALSVVLDARVLLCARRLVIGREKEIKFEVLVEAIEQALLTAYHKTPGAQEHARVELDRKSGHVHRARRGASTRRATRSGSTTTLPTGSAGSRRQRRSRSCCSACATPRTRSSTASSPARRATSSPAYIQQGRNPDDVLVDLGQDRSTSCRSASGCPVRTTGHGTRIKCLVVSVRKGMRGPQITLSRSHPNLVKKLFALEVPEIADGTVEIAAIAREAGHRTKMAVRSTVTGVNAKGACIGPMGQRVRSGDVRAPRREDRHRRLVRRPVGAGRARAVAGPGQLGPPVVDEAAKSRAGRRAGLPALPRHRQGTRMPGSPRA